MLVWLAFGLVLLLAVLVVLTSHFHFRRDDLQHRHILRLGCLFQHQDPHHHQHDFSRQVLMEAAFRRWLFWPRLQNLLCQLLSSVVLLQQQWQKNRHLHLILDCCSLHWESKHHQHDLPRRVLV